MHDSPQYALLQVIRRLHAQCKQQLNGLDRLLRTANASAEALEKYAATRQRIERLFSRMKGDVILGTCPFRTFTSRGLDSAFRSEWSWILDELNEVMVDSLDGEVAPDAFDSILSRLERDQSTDDQLALKVPPEPTLPIA